MKRPAAILSTFLLCLSAFCALGQVKNDFSDWNVPPPIPTGTIPKQPGATPKPVLLQPTDVPAPSLRGGLDLKDGSLPPVDQTAPDVEAPDQPAFPAMPFQTPDIPLPTVPQAMALPTQTLRDRQEPTDAEMPEPQAPDMPEMPPQPVIKPGTETGGDLKVPVVPAIITQPAVTALPANAFPFSEWPAPAIPENDDVSLSTTIDDNNNKSKNNVKRKQPRRLRSG